MPDLYTWANAETEVNNRIGNRSDIATRVTKWLNSAQLFLAKCDIELPRLESVSGNLPTVDATSEYTLTSFSEFTNNQIIGIRALRNSTSGFRMWKFGFDEYRSLSTQASGPPIRWARKGNLLAVDPKPDGVYNMIADYRRRPTAGTVEIDSEWHEVWIDLATYLGRRALQDYEEAILVYRGLPGMIQLRLQQPLSQDDWEYQWDEPGLVPGMSVIRGVHG